MTGYAVVGGETASGLSFTLSAKSVNHRFLDLHFRLPAGCDGLEMRLRQMLKARLTRGHLDLTLQIARREATAELRVDDHLLGEAVKAFREAAERHGVAGDPDLNVLLRLPGVAGVQRGGAGEDTAGLEEAAAGRVDDLMTALNAVRAEEGAALAKELRAGMQRLRGMATEVAQLRGGVREAQFTRLRARLKELVGEGVAEDRLLTEAAVLAERSDVEEEMVRMQTHVDRFVSMLDGGGEVGNRMDFLLQELNREANTMLSKTGAAAGEQGLRITELGLEMKSEIERAREQVQNLE